MNNTWDQLNGITLNKNNPKTNARLLKEFKFNLILKSYVNLNFSFNLKTIQ